MGEQLTPTGAGCLVLSLVAGVLILVSCVSKSGEEERPSYAPSAPAQSSGYATGYSLGQSMGRSGAGMPTDESLRSMSAMHAPNDQLQFRIGYRDGLVAGAQERKR